MVCSGADWRTMCCTARIHRSAVFEALYEIQYTESGLAELANTFIVLAISKQGTSFFYLNFVNA